MGTLLAIVRTSAVIVVYPLFAVIGMVLRWAGFISKKRRHHFIAAATRLWARGSCFIFNIRVKRVGEAKVASGSLIVANHIGTPDIFVLGHCFPGFFVSKVEIARWPLFRILAYLGDTIFAERSRRHQVKEIVAKMRQRLEDGCSVILFPEGQATDGSGVIDFKSSPFEAAVLAKSPVVPVTLVYHDRPPPSIACWHEMHFIPHILGLLKNPRLDVTVFIHEKIVGETSRGVLAESSCRVIRETYAREVELGFKKADNT